MIPINTQKIEKRVGTDGLILDVHSVFYTIQGEGPFCGWPCVFVRLAGCNLQCPSCDTDYTKGRIPAFPIDSLTSLVCDSFPSSFPIDRRLVVITGGEPFRQNITPFVRALQDQNIHVQVETNGTMAPSPELPENGRLTIVCSPKTGVVNKDLHPHIYAYKYVLDHKDIQQDGLPFAALNHPVGPKGLARPHEGFDGPVYLQPMDPKNDAQYLENVNSVKSSCMKNGFILQLQVHKIINVE